MVHRGKLPSLKGGWRLQKLAKRKHERLPINMEGRVEKKGKVEQVGLIGQNLNW